VLISSYNNARFVAKKLAEIKAQTWFARAEFLFLETGSPERERELFAPFCREHPNCRVLATAERKTLYQAWNLGWREARAPIVCYSNMDDAMRVHAELSDVDDGRVAVGMAGTCTLDAYPRDPITCTVKELTHIPINYIVTVNFIGFIDIVDKLGGVNIDVDHRYFNDNSNGENYATIDLHSGYQHLTGKQRGGEGHVSHDQRLALSD